MRYSHQIPCLAAWSIFLGALVHSPSFGQVEDLGSPFDQSAFASRISANGRVVIGRTLLLSTFADRAFRFTDADGFQVLPALNGIQGGPVGVSHDGMFVAGNIGSSRAVRWTEAGPPLELGTLGAFGTFATAISGDGSTIVGAAAAPTPGADLHAFRWTEAGGMVDIHPTFASESSWAEAVSLDGSVVVGSASIDLPSGDTTTSAFLWSAATGAIDLGAGIPRYAVATSVSEDGSVVAGRGRFGTARLQAFVWTAAGGMLPLGEIGTDATIEVTLSPDGSAVLGACKPVGFRWTPTTGLQTFSGSPWFHPTGASHDGTTMVGYLQSGQLSVGAAIWTAATGAIRLPGPIGEASAAYDVSADGSSIVGERPSSTGPRPVRWRTDGTIGVPYCDPAVANSASATGAYLTLGGSNQSDDQALELNVTDLPINSFGFFLVSRARDVILNPGGSQGTLCLGVSIGRFVGPGQIVNSGALGSFSLTVDPSSVPSPTGPVLPSFGETWHFQAWYRDANPGATSNFSSAASVPIY